MNKINGNETQWAHVPRELDDAGLSPQQFRLYCHLVRRVNKDTGYAWPSIASIMAHCFMCEATVNNSLNVLEDHRFIKRKRTGGTNHYFILPLSGIIPITGDNKDKIPSEVKDQIPNSAGYKGNTYKVNYEFNKKVNQPDCCEWNQSFNALPSSNAYPSNTDYCSTASPFTKNTNAVIYKDIPDDEVPL